MRQFVVIIYIIVISLSSLNASAFTIESINKIQKALKDKPIGERIAFWAEKFVGKPYDPDLLGEYVRKKVIVADERIDCMYHVFRSTELALSTTPQEAILIALDIRFHTKGILKDGEVLNYEDRFQYGEDMILSGKWGKDITEELGRTTYIKGSRGQDELEILLRQDTLKSVDKLRSGDIIFFIKDPEQRVVGEAVGHIGIIKTESRSQKPEVRSHETKDKVVYLIHASGTKGKNRSGSVKKVIFADYLKSMKFIGIKVARFEE